MNKHVFETKQQAEAFRASRPELAGNPIVWLSGNWYGEPAGWVILGAFPI